MKINLDTYVEPYFPGKRFDNIKSSDLEGLIKKHPYTPIPYFLLAKKYQDDQHPSFEQLKNKCLLFFNNPLWFDLIINEKQEVELPSQEHVIQAPENIQAEPAQLSELPDSSETIEEPANLIEGNIEKEVENPLEEPELIPFRLSSQLAEARSALEAKVEDDRLPFESEKLHTVDYFLSQGISVQESESQPTDKFGKQLKSFTEWLKTMKKVHPENLENNLTQGDEVKVKSLAESSLDDKEVFTDAMAEVLVKQNQIEKAIAIYNKLSLLNPDKSTYFAAKIEQLKAR